MRLVLIVLLLLLLFGGLPAWPYMAPLGYGYYPSGLIGLLLLVVIVVALLGPRRTGEL